MVILIYSTYIHAKLWSNTCCHVRISKRQSYYIQSHVTPYSAFQEKRETTPRIRLTYDAQTLSGFKGKLSAVYEASVRFHWRAV